MRPNSWFSRLMGRVSRVSEYGDDPGSELAADEVRVLKRGVHSSVEGLLVALAAKDPGVAIRAAVFERDTPRSKTLMVMLRPDGATVPMVKPSKFITALVLRYHAEALRLGLPKVHYVGWLQHTPPGQKYGKGEMHFFEF